MTAELTAVADALQSIGEAQRRRGLEWGARWSDDVVQAIRALPGHASTASTAPGQRRTRRTAALFEAATAAFLCRDYLQCQALARSDAATADDDELSFLGRLALYRHCCEQSTASMWRGKFNVLSKLRRELDAAPGGDGFTAYLLGLVTRDLRPFHRSDISDTDSGDDEQEQERRRLLDAAAAALRRAVGEQPALWLAWQALADLLTGGGPLSEQQLADELSGLPEHWMKRLFFEPYLLLRCGRDSDAAQLYGELDRRLGGGCHYVCLQVAACLVELRDFAAARHMYEKLRDVRPSALDGMDLYSNVLFLQEDVHELTYLAHEAFKIDRHHPVTCYIIGNYFSLAGNHHKAVVYFQRALALDPRFLAAWNLLGLEYVELRNTSAAIHAFRAAVDIDEREYRAWYGLGQSYELRKSPLFSIYYYRKAAALRPRDSRMFFAMAAQYEALGEPFVAHAIELYEQARQLGDPEAMAVTKLARLHEQRGHAEQAAHYHQLVVDHCDRTSERITPRLSEALWFLAQYHYQTTGRLHLTKRYCLRLQDFQCREGESAKSLLVQVHNEARHQKTDDAPASAHPSASMQLYPPLPSSVSRFTTTSSPRHSATPARSASSNISFIRFEDESLLLNASSLHRSVTRL